VERLRPSHRAYEHARTAERGDPAAHPCRAARSVPNPESCLRLVRAFAVEIHAGWLEASRDLNMDLLREHKTEPLRQLDQAG